MRKQSRLQTGRLEPLYPDKLSLIEGERKGRRRGKGGREGAVKEEKEIIKSPCDLILDLSLS